MMWHKSRRSAWARLIGSKTHDGTLATALVKVDVLLHLSLSTPT